MDPRRKHLQNHRPKPVPVAPPVCPLSSSGPPSLRTGAENAPGPAQVCPSLLPSQDAPGSSSSQLAKEPGALQPFLIIPTGLELMSSGGGQPGACLIILGRASPAGPGSPGPGRPAGIVNKDRISGPAGAMLAEFKTLEHIIQNRAFPGN